jgi:ATP synthase protein I
MADDTHDAHDPAKRSTDEAALSARLQRLGDRLGRERRSENRDTDRESAGAEASGFARGMRLSTELVAGVIGGAAIGWALDRLLGTSPWGLTVFLLLGFAGGAVNLVRAANRGTDSGT